MQEMIISIMNEFGYFGVFFLIAIENVFPPIPSEVILLFGGFMTTYTKLNIFGMVISSTLGSLFGAYILYYVGKFFHKERLKRMMSGKLGKVLRLKPEDIENADHWFDTKGQKTIFFCRFIPLIRSLISIPAGMSEMPLVRFSIYTILGSLIWNTVLIIVGSLVGSNWPKISELLNTYSHVVVVILVLTFSLGIFLYYRKKKKHEK